MRIGVDFDGVIVDTSKAKQKFCKDEFGVDIPLNLITGGGAKQFLTLEQYRRLKDYDFGKGTLFGELIPQVRETLGKLIYEGHKIIIVTGRHETGASYARKFLSAHKVPFHHLVYIQEMLSKEELEAMGRKKYEKVNVVRVLKLDVLIDDQYPNLNQSSGSGAMLLLLDQVWNRNVKIDKKDILRVEGWPQVYKLVQMQQAAL
ncbi:MAG: hypothetical protein HY363_02385 [Candidatus Aenigmarchaeota archaeon]|nr:hypothetical protein [Candidatus Aenigmarchaeota archaeon]